MRTGDLFAKLGVAAVLVLASASTADAQCAFNLPDRARQFSASLVRAMAPCPAITVLIPLPPNSETSVGTPACVPPMPLSTYSFDDKGRCQIKAKTKLEIPCSNGTGVPCTDLSIKVKCSGLLDSFGAKIGGGTATGWSLWVHARMTTDHDGAAAGNPGVANGDMTIIEFPVVYELPAGGKGKLKGIVGTNDNNCLLFGACPPKPSDCTNLELVGIRLLDPSGNPFAVPGSSTR